MTKLGGMAVACCSPCKNGATAWPCTTANGEGNAWHAASTASKSAVSAQLHEAPFVGKFRVWFEPGLITIMEAWKRTRTCLKKHPSMANHPGTSFVALSMVEGSGCSVAFRASEHIEAFPFKRQAYQPLQVPQSEAPNSKPTRSASKWE